MKEAVDYVKGNKSVFKVRIYKVFALYLAIMHETPKLYQVVKELHKEF